MFDITRQVVELNNAPPIVDSSTAVPVKIAYYVPPTYTITPTPTKKPTSTRKPTATATRSSTPTPKATLIRETTNTPTPVYTTPAPAAGRLVEVGATPTATAQSPVAPVTTGERYGLLPVLSPLTDRPAARQADLNLALRGAAPVSAALALVDYEGVTDGGAPQLGQLVGNGRAPAFSAAFQVYDWDWHCDCRGPLLAEPAVTLVGIKTIPDEWVRVPPAGSEIGNGYQVVVLYADTDRIVLKYTPSDSVKDGYTLHVESIAVDFNLLLLYRQANESGRSNLPALRAGQAFAKTNGSEIRVAVRDTGTFMDPRSRKDWWRGY